MELVRDNDNDWYWMDTAFVYWVDGSSPICTEIGNEWNKKLAKESCRNDIAKWHIQMHRGINVKWVGYRKKYKNLDGDAWNYVLKAKYQIHISLINKWGGTEQYQSRLKRVCK